MSRICTHSSVMLRLGLGTCGDSFSAHLPLTLFTSGPMGPISRHRGMSLITWDKVYHKTVSELQCSVISVFLHFLFHNTLNSTGEHHWLLSLSVFLGIETNVEYRVEDQKVQSPSFKINKSWGCNICHSNYS